MGLTKSHQFSLYQNDIASIAKAIGHPARVAIIEILLTKKNCICNDIVDILPLAQATISQHLKELKTAGIIQGTIEGKTLCYCINNEKIKLLSEFLQSVKNHQISCDC
ncbi:MAG: helix-turn-helix transcriptional regulator [Bacteroidia bacterium]|nr:helix-turn-helix transcriptional regulator [Bacteroidia bacterium]